MLFCLCIFYLPRTFSIWCVYFQFNTDIFYLTRIFAMQCRHFLFNANIFNSTRTFSIWRGYFQFNMNIFYSTRIFSIQQGSFNSTQKFWQISNFNNTLMFYVCLYHMNVLKGTQDWEFFWLRFWNLRYFFVSYVKILSFYQKKFLIGPLLGEVRFFRVVLGLREMKKNFELGQKNNFFWLQFLILYYFIVSYA